MKNAVTRAGAWLLVVLLSHAPWAEAQTVEWFAGGRLINDLPGTGVSLLPGSLTTAPDGKIYVVDWHYNRMLKWDPANSQIFTMPPGATLPLDYEKWGYVQRVFHAPNGYIYYVSLAVLYKYNPATGEHVRVTPLSTSTGSPGGACRDWVPLEFAMDSNGALYWTDFNYNAVCKMVSTLPFPIVSSDGGFSGDGGPASSARLNRPQGIAIDAANNIYIADRNNNRVRKITASTGIISTVAGNGTSTLGGENVVATASGLDTPYALAVDAAGSLYISEYGKYRVRRLDLVTGRIFTHAGTGVYSGIAQPSGVLATSVPIGKADMLAVDANGNLLISDGWQRLVRRVIRSTGIISTVAGNGDIQFCGDNGPPRDACLEVPRSVAVNASGDVFIADSGNHRVRKVSMETGLITTFAGKYGSPDVFSGAGGPATNVVFGADVDAVALDVPENLYVASGFRIHRIAAGSGILTTIAGSGQYGFSGDGGPALSARTGWITGIAVDRNGDVYFIDQSAYRVRRIAAGTGIISTFAGTGVADGPLGDGGPATGAALSPSKIAFDPAGNLLIGDSTRYRIRRVDKTTGIISTIAGNGVYGTTGDGGPATSASLSTGTFVQDGLGNILQIANPVRRIDATTGTIQSVGTLPLKTPEGFWANWGTDFAFGKAGELYSTTSQTVLKITGLPYAFPDFSPPLIQPAVSGGLAPSGWYTGDIQVSWSVTDPESPVSAQTGCGAASITQDTAGVSITCSATSRGGTTLNTVTLKRDATAPTLSFDDVTPAANSNGWNGTDVNIGFTASDATSGVASSSLASPLAFANEGIGMSQSVTVTDNAGNSATFESPAVSIDKTPPMVTPDVSGTPGSNGWYVSDLQVGWSINEIPTSIESSTGCDPTPVTLDTPSSTFTCSVTSAGGTTSSSTTVRRDATPPMLAFGTPAPAPNPAGWYNNDTSIPFTVDDVTSGVASTSQPSPLALSNEGVGLSRSVTVTDEAGNSASYSSAPINIDKTGPIVAPVVTGTLGSNEWYVGDVTVSWSVLEMPESITFVNGCETNTVNTDTGGVMFGCAANSQGGGFGMSQWIKRDTTPATVQWGAFSPVANANGWNKTNVTVPFTTSDALSGVASTSKASPLVISAEGAGVTAQLSVTDKAGNVVTVSSPARNIDKTVPVVSIDSPANGASYGFYQDVVADYGCTDISLLSCTAPNPDGEMVNTKTAGARSFKVTAKDSVNFTTAVTNSFNVASTFNFEGFLPNALPAPTPNLVPRGSLVPIRWKLPDGNGGYVSNPASFTSATVTTLSCSGTAVPLGDPASGPAGISFDPVTNVFTYNWQTGASWSGCRKIAIKLKDNVLHELVFKFQ